MPETSGSGPSSRGAPPAPHKRSVLFVEDDQAVRQSLAKTLARELQYDVHTVRNGEEAIRFLASNACDLIVSDLTMPGLSGSELVRALRSASRNASLIVISANDVRTLANPGVLPGVVAYLVKPLRRKALIEAVAKALSGMPGESASAC